MISAAIQAGILAAIISAIGYILFAIESALGKLIDLMYDMFMVFVGANPITVGGEETYILESFIGNDIVSTIYWGMALIGIALSFGFAIAAVVKKLFDYSGEKVKATYGAILLNTAKAILLIILMTAIVSTTITATGVLMDQVAYLFDNAQEINDPQYKEFTDQELATMFRIIDTVSNYGLNPSYDNRFNLNACFNAIRSDLQTLSQSKVFNYSYDGEEDSWQYCLMQIYLAADVNQDVDIDVQNEAVREAILEVINQVKYNEDNFKPIKVYDRGYSYSNVGAKFGRIFMLVGSFGAAKNSDYDGDGAGLTDQIRNPFYTGQKDIYSLSEVKKYFSVDLFDWNHLTVLLAEVVMIIEFAKMIFNAIARIFNIILLYITAPGFIAAIPLDDGGKFKQWTTAFVIQTLSIFGTFISIRLILVFVPIIMSDSYVLFENAFQNAFAKVIFVLGLCLAAQKSSGMFSGILADNAGYQSIMAGNVGDTGLGLMGKAGGYALRGGMKVGGAALSVGQSAVGALGGAIGSALGGGNKTEKGASGKTPTKKGPGNITPGNKAPQKPDPKTVSKPIDTSKKPGEPGGGGGVSEADQNKGMGTTDISSEMYGKHENFGRDNSQLEKGGGGGFKLDPRRHTNASDNRNYDKGNNKKNKNERPESKSFKLDPKKHMDNKSNVKGNSKDNTSDSSRDNRDNNGSSASNFFNRRPTAPKGTESKSFKLDPRMHTENRFRKLK